MNLGQRFLCGLGAIAMSAIAVSASAITYNDSRIYRWTEGGKTRIFFTGTPNATATYSYMPPSSSSTAIVSAKVKSVVMNGCGFKAVTRGDNFPSTFTFGGFSYTVSSLPSISLPPVCRKSSSGSSNTYIPSNWVR